MCQEGVSTAHALGTRDDSLCHNFAFSDTDSRIACFLYLHLNGPSTRWIHE